MDTIHSIPDIERVPYNFNQELQKRIINFSKSENKYDDMFEYIKFLKNYQPKNKFERNVIKVELMYCGE